jgi:hypothetical protein
MAHNTGSAHDRGVFSGPDPARDFDFLADRDRLCRSDGAAPEIDHDPATVFLDNQVAKGRIEVNHRSPHRHLRPVRKCLRSEHRHGSDWLDLGSAGRREEHHHGLDEW